jgi:acetyl esterase/lipase
VATAAVLVMGTVSCAPQNPALVATTSDQVMAPGELGRLPVREPDHRIPYGDHPGQYGELRLPAQEGPHPVAVLIHGGCWKQPYATLRDLAPMGDVLKAEGVASWNVEYRRLYETGSGWPGTYLDVGRAIDHLRPMASRYNLDLKRVVVIGHSAGGHLAMWAGARHRLARESPLFVVEPLAVRGVLNLAGTIDMTENIEHMEALCRDTVVSGMLGGKPTEVPERYAQVSAATMLPLGIPQVLVWGAHEDFVPLPLAEQYARAARQAGDSVRVLIIPGAGHFETASPFSPAWPAVRTAIQSLLAGALPR